MATSTTTQTMFMTKPGFAISGIFNFASSYTIALGGVAAGSMKEKEHPIVTGIARYRGCAPIAIAISQTTGNSMELTAGLLVTSVNMEAAKHKTKTISA